MSEKKRLMKTVFTTGVRVRVQQPAVKDRGNQLELARKMESATCRVWWPQSEEFAFNPGLGCLWHLTPVR